MDWLAHRGADGRFVRPVDDNQPGGEVAMDAVVLS